MKHKIKRSTGMVAGLCLLSSVLLFSAQAQALGLSDLKVNSYLGEPLKAQFLVMQLPDGDTQEIKVRLASAEDYRKMSLVYPVGVNFSFNIVRKKGQDVVVKVTSSSPIEDPFVNLLVEFTSSAGKISRGYTFLLDPAPGFADEPAFEPIPSNFNSDSANNLAQAPVVLSPNGRFIFDQGEARYTQEEKVKPQKKRPASSNAVRSSVEKSVPNANKVRVKSSDQAKPVARSSAVKADKQGDVLAKSFGKMSMSLSTSLSISKSVPAGVNNSDALQEELIAKEKAMKSLGNQPGVVAAQGGSSASQPKGIDGAPAANTSSGATTLPSEMGLMPSTDVAANGEAATVEIPPEGMMEATGSADNAEMMAPVVESTPPAPVFHEESSTTLFDKINQYWTALVGILVLILLAIVGGAIYSKRKKKSGWQSSLNQTNKDSAKDVSKVKDKPTVVPVAKPEAKSEIKPKVKPEAKKSAGIGAFFAGLLPKKKPKSAFGKGVAKTDQVKPVQSPVENAIDKEQVVSNIKVSTEEAAPKKTFGLEAPSGLSGTTAAAVGGIAAATATSSVIEKNKGNSDHSVFDEAIVKPKSKEHEKPLDFGSGSDSQIKQPTIKMVEKPVAKEVVATQESEEFNLLEEADIYLRFGHNKLAEEVLREAIKLNNKNAKSYVTLLGILEARGDSKEFAVLAAELKSLGDAESWDQAVVMGRKLDPNNPLYA